MENNIAPVGKQHVSDGKELAEVLSGLKPEKQKQIKTYVHSLQTSFSGPLPPPEILQGYDQVQEGLAERIVAMAEREQAHRIECDNIMISEPVKATRRGQWMGFVCAFLGLATSVLLAYFGATVVAGVVGGSTVLGLVTVFITNRPPKDNF